MIMKARDPSNAAEEPEETEEVEAVAEMEVAVEEIDLIRKEIVVNNMTDSIYGKSVQRIGTVQLIRLEEETMEVVVVDAVAAAVEAMVNRAFTTNTIHK